MKQRVWGVGVLRTNAITFGLMILVTASVFCSLSSGEVRALSLPRIIDDVTAPILDTSPGRSEQAPPSATPAAASNSQQAAPTTAGAPAPASDTATNSSAVAGNDAPLELLPTYSQDLQRLTDQSRSDTRPTLAHALRTMPSSSFVFLQPSEQGWKIFGIPWYYWMLIVIAIVGGWWWFSVQKAKRLLSLAFWA